MNSNPLMATLSKKYSNLPDREATNRLQDLRLRYTLQEAKATVETSTACPQLT
jgi:hypothetical protein